MNQHSRTIQRDPVKLPALPKWVTTGMEEAPQNVAFLSGASLSVLDAIICQDDGLISQDLLSNALALKAAVATSKLEGRMSTEADIRDAYYLTPQSPGGSHHWGPDGDCLAFWRGVVRQPLAGSDWIKRVQKCSKAEDEEEIEAWLQEAMVHAPTAGPLSAAIGVMRTVMDANDRDERLACFLSDVALAKTLSWDRPLPLTALYLTKARLRDLCDGAGDAEFKIQVSITRAVQDAVLLAKKVASKTDAIRAIAPKLRSRGAEDAVAVFLSENIVSPSNMLSPTIKGTRTEMSPRNARRLCDRLVELGVIRELTGRSTFRLYGVGV